jgi:hypothetical protein
MSVKIAPLNPQTEVPPHGALPDRRDARRPHIFTVAEVRD